MEQEINKTSTE